MTSPILRGFIIYAGGISVLASMIIDNDHIVLLIAIIGGLLGAYLMWREDHELRMDRTTQECRDEEDRSA
jgi:hypothetical protein